MEIMLEPLVTHMQWHRTSGFQYVYCVAGAPWIKPRKAFDLELPVHWQEWIDDETRQHAATTIVNGTESVTLTPTLECVESERTASGVTLFRATVGWHDGTTPVHVEQFTREMTPQFHETHRRHVESIHDQIPITLFPTHNTGVPHRRGHGPIRPETTASESAS